jgi:UDP-N-acetylmuramoyl-tripeptide--D-alanyl-D-alanine ligase
MLRRLAQGIGAAVSRLYDLCVWALAFVWRTLLFRTTFVAITGSVGKTTAKECLAAILSGWQPAIATVGNRNGRGGVSRTILRARPWHRLCVVEIGTDRPGNMIRGALLVRPHIALILSVAGTHSKDFKTLEGTAREKSRLLTFLGSRGVAVLNGDDPRVAAMAQRRRCRVVWFGSSPEFDVRASDATGQWPERLRFRASTGEQSCEVKTQFVGCYWVSAVLGALATAHACGVPLAQAAACVENVAPFRSRMQPVSLANGAVVLRDEYNCSYSTALRAFEVMRSARAERRIMVLSDCNDLTQDRPERVKILARMACESADAVIFVGEDARHGAEYALDHGLPPQNVHAFAAWEEAAHFLSADLRAGDLVLIRNRRDGHFGRIYFALQGEVKCHLAECPLRITCDNCSKLGFAPRSKPAIPDTLAVKVN